MEKDFDKKSILEMSSGAILELVDYEVGRVLENILDPNTKPDAKRKITVSIEFKPAADRKTISVETTAKSQLVPTSPVATALYVTGRPSTGEAIVAELVRQVPGQTDIYGGEQEAPKILNISNKRAI